ncbi:MAG: alpha-amylase [Anaerolineae bacterium]|nr:alpha-amylase [Anaerolineae bacterium]
MKKLWLVLILILAACGTPTVAPTAAPTNTPAPTARPTATPQPTTATDLAIVQTREPVAVAPVGMDGVLVSGTDGAPWWNDTVFYEIFVRSFYDSDGDGVGDLNGLIERLDYLNDGDPATGDDLGVTGIWLMPIAQSPSYHGYDVTDYYKVDDEYGSNEDFKRLINAAHQRGIRVIVDMVLNHTSAEHPWFEDARSSVNSEYRDWYLWADSPGTTGWHRNGTKNEYYYGIFWDQMPDLNYENPEVTAEMRNVIRFWLEEMGVDGFRLDAVKHLIEEDTQLENTKATHAWLEGFRVFYKGIKPDAFTVGEIWSPSAAVVEYIGDELDIAFEFDMADAIVKTASSGRPSGLKMAQKTVLSTYPPNQFATFLANHDQNRTRSRLVNDEQAELAATLQLAFPGVPFIYYGEEIAMQGIKPDENIRLPMQWTAAGGFSSGTPWRDYYKDYKERNVAAQQQDAGSVWHHYNALIQLRNTHAALRTGETWIVVPDRTQIYGYVRANDDEIILVLVNLSKAPVDGYSITLGEGPFKAGLQPALLMGAGELHPLVVNDAGGLDPSRPVDVLPPYGSVILQYALQGN